LNAGKYTVTASGPTGYTSSYSSGCSGTASGGTPVKCTVSNKYTAPAPTPAPGSTTFLNVITNVDNTNGGTKKPSDFTISVSGKSPSPKSFSGSSSGTSVTLNAGKYTVTASGSTGYTSSYSSECSATASAGTPVKCTVSNKYTAPAPVNAPYMNLTVIMKVDNTKGGTKKPSDFSISVSGNSPSPKSFYGSSDGIVVALRDGPYTVDVPQNYFGYSFTTSALCQSVAHAGYTIRCTISASYAPSAKLSVIMNVDNTRGGTKKPSDFSISVSGNRPSPKAFSGSSSGTSVTLNPGQFTVVARGGGLYNIKTSPECSGTASEGETITCTISASYVPPKLSVIMNVDNTRGGTKKPGDFLISVSGNPSPYPEYPAPKAFYGSSSGTSVYLNPGQFTIVAGAIPLYDIKTSPECSGTASEGATFKCTISASYSPPPPPPPSSVKIHFIIIDRANCGFIWPIDYGPCPALRHTEIYVERNPGEPIAQFVAHSNHEYVEIPGQYVGQTLYLLAEPTPSLVVDNFKYDKFIFYIPPPNQPNHQCGNYYSDHADCYFTMPPKGIDIEIDTYWHNTMLMPSAK
jgi:Prealbumin-like fold domain